MSAKIAACDIGGTKGLVSVFAYGNPEEITDSQEFQITSDPNEFSVDVMNLCDALDKVGTNCGGFEAISLGVAGRVKNGRIASAGKLHSWVDMPIIEVLQGRYGVPVIIENDGGMLTAAEVTFGALADSRYYGKDALIIAPGTGIAVCVAIYRNGQYIILPGEGAHMTTDMYGPGEGDEDCCGQQNCVESVASGRMLERHAAEENTTPANLTDDEVNELMGLPLGALVRNIVDLHPTIDVVVMSGGITHKRPTLMETVESATTAELRGVIPTPAFVLSRFETGGLLGCLARWMVENPA